MFVFKPTEKTYSDPASSIFKPGIPFGFEYSRGDICFYHDELLGSKMFFNSKILRQAILDSKDYLEEVLDLKIEDAREPEEVKEEVVEETTEPEVEETTEATSDESTDEVEAPTNEEAHEESTEDTPAEESAKEESAEEPVMFEEADIPVKEKKSNKKK